MSKDLFIQDLDAEGIGFKQATMEDVVDWWLSHYEGLEHLTEGGDTSPECWYTINVILRRSFEKIKNRSKLK
jgi:hypothetical protein